MAAAPDDLRLEWRNDMQAVVFEPEGHGAACMIHRLAIRTLAGAALSPDDCLAYGREHEAKLRAAATAKIRSKSIPPGHSLHLTSRDVRRLPVSSSS